MIARRCWTAFALLLFPAFVALAADDAYGDPIPEGAKLRLGTARLRSSNGSPTALTPNGRFLVCGTSNGAIGFLDANGEVTRAVRVDGEFGTVIAFSGDAKRALSTGYQGVFVWDTGTGKVLTKMTRNTVSGDNGVSFSIDGKVFAAGGTKSFNEKEKEKLPTAVIWDVEGKKQVSEVTPVQNESVFVALSPDGKRFATWGYYYDPKAKEQPKPEADPSRLVQFWNAADGKEIAKSRLLTGGNPATVVFSPDGSLAAVSNGEGSIHLIDPATGTERGLLLGRTRQGRKIAFSPDGKTLASAGDDASIQRWNVADGKRLGITEAPMPLLYTPRGLLFTDNERVVAWTIRGLAAYLWEAPSGKLLNAVGGHTSPITGAVVAGGGKELFTAAGDGTILRWDPAKGKELGSLSLKIPAGGYGNVVTGQIILSADGTRALAHDGSGLAVYDLPAGTQQYVIPGDYNRDNQGSFSSDSNKVVQVMSSYDVKKNPARVAVWDVVTTKKLVEIELPGWNQVSASLTPDGKTLVTMGMKVEEKGESEFMVTGWEVGTGKKRGEFTEQGGFGAMAMGMTGDNKTAVVLSPKSGPLVVDFVNGTKVRALDLGGKRPGSLLVVSPDGKQLAVQLQQEFGPIPTSKVLVLDIESGKTKKTLSGITGNMSTITFSPDSKTLITGSYDTTALVWDIMEK